MVHFRNDGNTADKDEAKTPLSLFNKLNERFHFEVDAAANCSNSLCGDAWLQNALEDPWMSWGHTRFFCNPPYSRGNLDKFVKKGYDESVKGATVVMLLPADTSTKSFKEYCMKASEIIFIQPRVHFNNPDGTPMVGSPKFGSMVVVFRTDGFDGSPVISTMDWR